MRIIRSLKIIYVLDAADDLEKDKKELQKNIATIQASKKELDEEVAECNALMKKLSSQSAEYQEAIEENKDALKKVEAEIQAAYARA